MGHLGNRWPGRVLITQRSLLEIEGIGTIRNPVASET
jgi:hypothetical protein